VVEPIGEDRQQLVRKHTAFYIRQAAYMFGRDFGRVPVRFDLSGTTAGMYTLHGKNGLIRYNPWIFGKYFDENLRDTVPHEVAHYIVYAVYGDRIGRRRVKPHGPQWREVMDRFGADPGVTFDLDLEGVPQRRQRTHRYRCDCRLHELSTTRHNRVMRGRGSYQCVHCEGDLVYAPEAT